MAKRLYYFHSRSEADAFSAGVEFFNDSAVLVTSIRIPDGFVDGEENAWEVTTEDRDEVDEADAPRNTEIEFRGDPLDPADDGANMPVRAVLAGTMLQGILSRTDRDSVLDPSDEVTQAIHYADLLIAELNKG